MEAYGIRQYGERVRVEATCDEGGHEYTYTLYATEYSKESPCLDPYCDGRAWPSR